jgi:hypothetical protein
MQDFPKILVLLLLLGFGPMAYGQDDSGMDTDPNEMDAGAETSDEKGASEESKKTEVYYAKRFINWHLDPILGDKTPTGMDTVPLNFQNMTFPEKSNTVGSEYLANIGSPFQSKVFMDRKQKTPFLFANNYDYWITSPQEQVFYNTTVPYTNLRYLTTFGNDVSQEENFKFLFTVNVNKRLNIGVDYEILYARGFYAHNSNRVKMGNVFGNYQSPRYEAYWQLSFNALENFENGGITDDRYITQPLLMSGGLSEYESLNIPVAFENAKSLLQTQHYFLNHKYHLGFERLDIVQEDSLSKGKVLPKGAPVPGDSLYTFVPVSSIIHSLYIDNSQKTYKSSSANLSYYGHAYLDDGYTSDTCALLQIRNTLGLSLEEGFHKWVKFGLTAFLEHDFRRYARLIPNATVLGNSVYTVPYENHLVNHYESLVWVGGELSRHTGELLNFTARAKLCLIGEDIGDFEVKGDLKTTIRLWDHPISLTAEGALTNLHPDYFIENYYSNHFKWSNSFKNEIRTFVRGNLFIPALGFEAHAAVENLTNFTFFNNDTLPDQYEGNIQVLTLNLKQHLGMGILNWDNNLVWQLSSNQNILPLPTLALYSDLYLKFMVSKVLTTHIGVDCRYNTAYYAQAYMPATGQFYNQNLRKIGDYPYMNAYGNFHLKRMRFFIMYSHLSRFFASPNYFSAPQYPLNPAIIKVGLSWNFYD